ncbi:MAG TPA: hypothetical protein VJ571_07870 [Candidatus Nitrosotalea sp.]|nr:hypothetical protein [Candidatus Nitrosotalea sp.]
MEDVKHDHHVNTLKKEYLESYDELRKSPKAHREYSDISNLVCCDVKKYHEEYGKELVSIIKARERLEDFINKLDREI